MINTNKKIMLITINNYYNVHLHYDYIITKIYAICN